ncbi:hypothetical protein XM48_10735 [Leucobacter sp. Ag1]|nr:hypothetical protein XM48_10735 [Leucobacter sp. Ag1]
MLALVEAPAAHPAPAAEVETIDTPDPAVEPQCPAGWEDEWAALPVLASPEDLAEFFGVEISTLTDWRYHEKGPKPMKLGGRLVRYRRHRVIEWLVAADATASAKA